MYVCVYVYMYIYVCIYILYYHNSYVLVSECRIYVVNSQSQLNLTKYPMAGKPEYQSALGVTLGRDPDASILRSPFPVHIYPL